jgi:hypothetical protein
MVDVSKTTVIRCSAAELLEFVMDIEAYTAIDEKIGPIDWARRRGDVADFVFTPRLPGIPIPVPKVLQYAHLTPGKPVDIGFAPPPANRLAHLSSRFHASFVATPMPEGTKFTRTFSLTFGPPLGWLVEPILARTLPADIEGELAGAKRCLEALHTPGQVTR